MSACGARVWRSHRSQSGGARCAVRGSGPAERIRGRDGRACGGTSDIRVGPSRSVILIAGVGSELALARVRSDSVQRRTVPLLLESGAGCAARAPQDDRLQAGNRWVLRICPRWLSATRTARAYCDAVTDAAFQVTRSPTCRPLRPASPPLSSRMAFTGTSEEMVARE